MKPRLLFFGVALAVPALLLPLSSCSETTDSTTVPDIPASGTPDGDEVAGMISKAEINSAELGLASTTSAPQAIPFAFVGTATECDANPDDAVPGIPGARIVTAAWLRGMGLPDNGGANNSSDADPANAPNKGNVRRGLLLSKNGQSEICSAAGARITNVRGLVVGTDFALGFDYRNGGHCGGGAPRFNVVARHPDGTDVFHFIGGCANDVGPIPAPQDPAEWTRVRFDASDPNSGVAGIPVGSTIRSITLILDEGTDTANNDTQGVGLAVLDNIFIDGQTIRRGSGIAPS